MKNVWRFGEPFISAVSIPLMPCYLPWPWRSWLAHHLWLHMRWNYCPICWEQLPGMRNGLKLRSANDRKKFSTSYLHLSCKKNMFWPFRTCHHFFKNEQFNHQSTRNKQKENSKLFWRVSNLNWVVVSNIFYFHPYLGKIPILTNIFQMGWNHQPAKTSNMNNINIHGTFFFLQPNRPIGEAVLAW